MATSAIEGIQVDRLALRSSVNRRLNIENAGLSRPDRYTDGLGRVLQDASTRYFEPLTSKRLYQWYSWLFLSGYSRFHPIDVGKWRTAAEPMRVVSGSPKKEIIHFEAPPADRLESEMISFIEWFNSSPGEEQLIIAAEAPLRFVTIHPFDDGNGRIARAVSDLVLFRDEDLGKRLYSMSKQIHLKRSEYYDILERTQKGNGHITEWILWSSSALRERYVTR